MNLIANATGENFFEMGLAVVGAFLGVLILRAINRKVNVFTRGTVSFMLTALIIFTAVDTVAIMNGIRNNQTTARSLADHHTVTSIVCSWIDQGADLAAHQVSGDLNQETLISDLRAAEEDIAIELERKNARGETMGDLKLVALSVDRYGRIDGMSRHSRRFDFKALVDDGASYHRVEGRVSIRHRGENGISIVNFKSGIDKAFNDSPRLVANAYSGADSYRSDNYHLDSRRGYLIRRNLSPKDD
ncbi:MAG: hypothetical protein ACI97A_003082 [Planctomycetota bacterium]|jgi:hypothetical protein